MRRLWRFLTNRVTAGMFFFLLLMAVWQFAVKPAYFPQSLIAEEDTR